MIGGPPQNPRSIPPFRRTPPPQAPRAPPRARARGGRRRPAHKPVVAVALAVADRKDLRSPSPRWHRAQLTAAGASSGLWTQACPRSQPARASSTSRGCHQRDRPWPRARTRPSLRPRTAPPAPICASLHPISLPPRAPARHVIPPPGVPGMGSSPHPPLHARRPARAKASPRARPASTLTTAQPPAQTRAACPPPPRRRYIMMIAPRAGSGAPHELEGGPPSPSESPPPPSARRCGVVWRREMDPRPPPTDVRGRIPPPIWAPARRAASGARRSPVTRGPPPPPAAYSPGAGRE